MKPGDINKKVEWRFPIVLSLSSLLHLSLTILGTTGYEKKEVFLPWRISAGTKYTCKIYRECWTQVTHNRSIIITPCWDLLRVCWHSRVDQHICLFFLNQQTSNSLCYFRLFIYNKKKLSWLCVTSLLLFCIVKKLFTLPCVYI